MEQAVAAIAEVDDAIDFVINRLTDWIAANPMTPDPRVNELRNRAIRLENRILDADPLRVPVVSTAYAKQVAAEADNEIRQIYNLFFDIRKSHDLQTE